ncbi:MAG: helix-turn-helix transcriptional regulator [Rhodobacteraceae bacterium]|nr:helix-turn-helix transcriptional regulator [Paracoccaceae bacterium]
MDVVDGKWIKDRLTGKRGEQARLAERMGVDPDKVSKILSGTRQVKPHELPHVMAFFDKASPEASMDSMASEAIARRIGALTPENLKKLSDYVSLLELDAIQADKDT